MVETIGSSMLSASGPVWAVAVVWLMGSAALMVACRTALKAAAVPVRRKRR